jgi:hypothetical protein
MATISTQTANDSAPEPVDNAQNEVAKPPNKRPAPAPYVNRPSKRIHSEEDLILAFVQRARTDDILYRALLVKMLEDRYSAMEDGVRIRETVEERSHGEYTF